ncbi:MAG: hypothetical protein IPN33_20610 [Saprospiraceae bacterium]|nr:hypothetical protein [Saprospiraceae bacterium]
MEYFESAKSALRQRLKARQLLASGSYPQPADTIDPARFAALMLSAQLLYNLDETLVKS